MTGCQPTDATAMRTPSDRLQLLDEIFTEAAERGLLLQTAKDEALDGRTIRLTDRDLVSFGSCSYLGLEMDERLKQGVVEAVGRYGTQFSSSRTYLSAPAYEELEALLGRLFGGSVMLAASTSLGHLATLPTVVGANDAVILDQQVHHSVQLAVNQLRVTGVTVEVVRHNRMDLLEERVEELARTHERIWYMADGVYSMFADLAPVDELAAMHARHEQLHLYFDDSHGMSWAGRHGRGTVLDRMPIRPRMIVAASLNKAFAAAGGAFVFSSEEEARRVRTCGGTMIFCGPIQPPMLGAALASARIHLSPEIDELQARLRDRVTLCNRLLEEHALPLVAPSEAPIRYVGCGVPRIAHAMAERLLEEGYYVNAAFFPAVPMKQGGIRAPISVHHTPEDIRGLVEAMAHHLPRVFEQEGTSVEAVRAAFGLEAPAPPAAAATARRGELVLQSASTIDALDAAEWDGLLGDEGTFTAEGLRFLEATFSGRAGARPEDDWSFRYYVVRDASGRPVLATFFTAALWKDDMLAPAEVSARVEARRAQDPYFLTTRTFGMGSLLTEGRHLFLDRDADWQGALALLLDAAAADQLALDAATLVVRDLPTDDEELAAFLRESGLVQIPMLDSHVVELDAPDEPAHLAGLSYRARTHVRREALAREDDYAVEILGAGTRVPSDSELDHLYDLYLAVERRGLELNSFDLPRNVLRQMLAHPCWELVLLRLAPGAGGPADGRPVAFGAHFRGREHYAPMVVGLDYEFVVSHGAYRQGLLRALRRGRELGAARVCFGMGASLEKRRFGAVAHARSAFARADDHYGLEVLASIEAESSGAPAPRVRVAG